jgi:hypothetical protein
LEEDVLPHPTFFRYCEELLERYRNNEKVALSCGSNFQNGHQRGEASYYFSDIPWPWGWAGWRRSWENHSIDLKGLDKNEVFARMKKAHFHRDMIRYWKQCWWEVETKKVNTWDYQLYLSFVGKQVVVMPNVNLVTNIGYLMGGAHGEKNFRSPWMARSCAIHFPLVHPNVIQANRKADLFFLQNWLATWVGGFCFLKWKYNPVRLAKRAYEKFYKYRGEK